MCASCDTVRQYAEGMIEEGKSHSLATAVLFLLHNYFAKCADEAVEELPPFFPEEVLSAMATSVAFNQLMHVATVAGVRAQVTVNEEEREGTMGAAMGNMALVTAVTESVLTGRDVVEWVETEILARVRNMRDDPNDTTIRDCAEFANKVRDEMDGEPMIIDDPNEVLKLLDSLGMSLDDAPDDA